MVLAKKGGWRRIVAGILALVGVTLFIGGYYFVSAVQRGRSAALRSADL